jgi:hypothetical protein
MTAARTIAIAYFDNNTGHADLDPLRKDLTYDPFVVYQPRPWLLREGWKKAGSTFYREVPPAKR